MRHGKKINHLGRKTAHRHSMLANMACSLVEHKSINTTVAKLGNRLGDNADMAMIELVDFNELYNAGKATKKKSTRRSRRGSGSSAAAAPAAKAAPAKAEKEAKKEEE